MLRRMLAVSVTALTTAGFGIALTALPASAAHTHYVATPNGECHQVAAGQTSISDPAHSGYHQYHEHVHLGATGDPGTAGDNNLGQGRAQVQVYKEGPAPAVCDGN